MPRLSGWASPHCFLCGTGLLSRERFLGLVLPAPPLTFSGTARLCWGTEAAADGDMPVWAGGRERVSGGRPFLDPPAEPSLALPRGAKGACNDGKKMGHWTCGVIKLSMGCFGSTWSYI